ncbi:MAG: hypothetical protein V1674_06835 [Candidatus Omnitrophota bacterium]
MIIEIINLDKSIKFNFRKNIEELLKFVPQEDLYKINKITIIDYPVERNVKDAAGLYYGYQNAKNIEIVLNVSGMFYKMPRIFFIIFPIIPKLLLATTLFHEIGHHVQRIGHGYKKEGWEKTAEQYSKEITKKVFLTSRLFKALKLFKFLLVPILKFYKIKNRKNSVRTR